ncbi:MAG: hypothetical protein LIQ31_02085, partial [Planctomycetes bacterium]|nr:hypothetical protein [Planctomycetota bacterium]
MADTAATTVTGTILIIWKTTFAAITARNTLGYVFGGIDRDSPGPSATATATGTRLSISAMLVGRASITSISSDSDTHVAATLAATTVGIPTRVGIVFAVTSRYSKISSVAAATTTSYT